MRGGLPPFPHAVAVLPPLPATYNHYYHHPQLPQGECLSPQSKPSPGVCGPLLIILYLHLSMRGKHCSFFNPSILTISGSLYLRVVRMRYLRACVCLDMMRCIFYVLNFLANFIPISNLNSFRF